MDKKAIIKTYAKLSANEAFEVFDSNDVDFDMIEEALGKDVAGVYVNWIYENLK